MCSNAKTETKLNDMKREKKVYPADKNGRCLRGFCPTICYASDAERIAKSLAADLQKFGIKYNKIIIEEA